MENYKSIPLNDSDGYLWAPVYRFALREDLKDQKQFLPTRGEPLATGWDVKAAQLDKEPIIFHPFMKYMVPLGFRAFCPQGWWLKLNPRSSSFAKKSLHSLYGVIDETYEGEMVWSCQYIPSNSLADHPDNLVINFGDAIGQLIPIRRQEMVIEEVSNEEYNLMCKNRGAQRGSGGFGSTSI